MKKLFALLPALILLFVSCERRQQILHEGSSVADDSSIVQWKEFLDHDTFVREVRSQGKIILLAKASSEEDFRDSTFSETSFFADGKPMALRIFSQGKQNGVWMSWYQSGKTKSKSVVDHGILRDYLSYYEDGTIAVTGSRSPNGIMSRTERWRNGNLKETFTTDTAGNGKCTNYFENGRKSTEGRLSNFVQSGTWSRWDSTGNMLSDTSYYELTKD